MASSFSRKTTKDPNEGKSKKIVLMGVLGVVLVGLVIHQFGGAKSTEASTGGDGAQPVAPGLGDSPAIVLASLDANANGKGGAAAGKALAALSIAPTDPFRISEEWLKQLSHPVSTATTEKPPIKPIELIENKQPTAVQQVENKQPVKPETPVVAWEPTGLKLNGIFRDGGKISAFINGSVVTEGNVIGGAKIVEITMDYVTVQQDGNPKGQLFSLKINHLKKQGS